MSLKDAILADIHNVFLNLEEFAENRTVLYDGERYVDIPITMSGIKEQDRRQLVSDHVQGLYAATTIMHCAQSDLGGKQPEKGQRISINDAENGEGFFREFYVVSSVCRGGMLRVELEAIDE